jgi:hypothetical protein
VGDERRLEQQTYSRSVYRSKRSLAWHRPLRWRAGSFGRWLWMASSLLILYDGAIGHKLDSADVPKIETATGRMASDLTEEELLAVMRKLGIRGLELGDEDRAAIAEAMQGPALG